MVICECRRGHAIKIAAARHRRRHCNRVSNLHTFRIGIDRHGEISDCSGKVRRRVGRQRLYVECQQLALDRYILFLGGSSERIRKERIREKVVHVKSVERGTRTGTAGMAGDKKPGGGFDWADVELTRPSRSDGSFECVNGELSAVDQFDLRLLRALPFLHGESLAGYLRSIEGYQTCGKTKSHHGWNHLSNVCRFFRHDQLSKYQLPRA